MRVAVLYDLHGNLPALDAVLDEIRQLEVDQIIVGGDVLPGPMPGESLDRLLTLDIPIQFIQGNGEDRVLAYLAGTGLDTLPEHAREVVRWSADQLTLEQARVLAGWPKTLRLMIPGIGDVLFCHATPRSDTEIFTRLTPEERLLPIFGQVDLALVVCGHTHMQFDRRIGKVRVINAGSVGQPFGEPRADWLLLGPDVELRHTNYDIARAAELIGETAFPHAREYAARYIVQPPSEAQMLEAFGRAEIGKLHERS